MIDVRRWPDGDAVLDELLDLPAARRRDALDARTDLDPELRRAIEAVLFEAAAADPFLDPSAVAERPLVRELRDELARDDDHLKPGDRFAQYEIVALSGRGGMGEVYRARDPRLGRDVALKVLPRDVTADAERLARFDREARMLASLNHPNIAAIYGLADDEGRRALVLEFVEGETLAERLVLSPLRLTDVVSVARQVALALDAAHHRGIVHRDLKPANIKVTHDGTVKVLDFGLAKALDTAPAAAVARVSLTGHWKPGAVLGTPMYMAPEQARGHTVDHRADVWAFGCGLYEMLAGRPPFEGDSAGEVLARVIEREPDFTAVPSATPPALQRLLRRALAKDPARRLASMADAVLDLDEAAEGVRAGGWFPVRHLRAAAGILLLAIATLAVAAFAWTRWLNAPPAPVRLAVPVPGRDMLLASGQQVAALSPDGRTVVYRAIRDGQVHLFVHTLNALEAQPLAGTANASAPFFSPDGRWVGFDGEGVLQKVALGGGSPVAICSAPGGVHASWGGESIVFATDTARVLHRVAAIGGTPEALTALDTARGDAAHTFPFVLPDGQAALFTIVTATERHIAVVRFATREVRVLTTGSQPRYLDDGHLLFLRNDSLWAAPFNARTFELRREPRPVLEGLDTAAGSVAHFAASRNGSLLYVPRRAEVRERDLVWLDRSGREAPLPLLPGRYTRAALAPDGRRIAVALSDGNNTDIWTAAEDQVTLTRVTREPTSETAPLWTPDGRAIAFRSDRDGGGLFLVPAHGAGDAQRLTSSPGTLHTPHGWTPDGRRLLFTEFRTYAEQAIAAVDVETGNVERLLTGRFAQLRPQVSPSGRWFTYQSDESGRFEIYVRPYPALDEGRWKVSHAGGTSPRWAQDGSELLYHDGTGIVSVRVLPREREFVAEAPRRLFAYTPYSSRLGPDYEVTRDGRRFLMIRGGADSPASRLQLLLIQNWSTELRDRLRRD